MRTVDTSALLLEASLGLQNWTSAMNAVAASLGATGACLNMHGAGRGRELLPASDSYRAMLQEFLDGWSEQDIRARRGWKKLVAGAPVLLENDLSRPSERARLDIYRDLFHRHGMDTWATMGMRVDDELWVCSVARPAGRGDFTAMDAMVMKEQADRLTPVLRILRANARRAQAGVVDLLDRIGSPAIFIDLVGRLVTANARAEGMLGAEIGVAGGRITLSDKQAEQHLKDLLASSPFPTPGAGKNITVRRDGARPLVLNAILFAAAAGEALGATGWILIVRDPDAQTPADLTLLSSVFGASRQECQVAALLEADHSLREAADQLGVSLDTIRKHVKSLLRKTDCRTQTEFGRMLARLPRSERLIVPNRIDK